jgi:hypothetical protein
MPAAMLCLMGMIIGDLYGNVTEFSVEMQLLWFIIFVICDGC